MHVLQTMHGKDGKGALDLCHYVEWVNSSPQVILIPNRWSVDVDRAGSLVQVSRSLSDLHVCFCRCSLSNDCHLVIRGNLTNSLGP